MITKLLQYILWKYTCKTYLEEVIVCHVFLNISYTKYWMVLAHCETS